MAPDAITFRASLDGFPGVDRDVAVRNDQTLIHLHRVLQAAFGWDDDHLYSFWLDGKFWSSVGGEYTHPWHANEPNPLGAFWIGPVPQSAEISIDRLELSESQ